MCVSLIIILLTKVNCTLRTLADTFTENTEFLNKLAAQTEDFAVQLIDQVTGSEQLVISDQPENEDRCAPMLSEMTDDAIVHSQKKVGIFLIGNCRQSLQNKEVMANIYFLFHCSLLLTHYCTRGLN